MTSLVLVAVTVAISFRSYINLQKQFDVHRRQAHEQLTRDIESLTKESLDRLRQLASMIPSLAGVQRSLMSGDAAKLREVFEARWPGLQFDFGIDVVAFYDAGNQLLASWETTGWRHLNRPQVTDWLQRVNHQEIPVTALNCSDNCMQYAVVPILAQGHSVGALLVASSLAEVMQGFRKISENDIGLLIVNPANASDQEQDDQRIPKWEAEIVAFTNFDRSLKVLRQASAEASLKLATTGWRTVLGGRSQEISFFLLPDLAGGNPAYLVIIADITQTLDEIRSATREIVLVGGVGWLLSQLLLLVILWTPMSRLRQTARSLPMLALSQFREARSVIAGQARPHMLDDEIDILDNTAIALAERLERLEQKVEEHTRALSRRMEELAKERDFVANLLDTAQVIIIAQDRQGRIVMANPFAYRLTGYNKKEMSGRLFVQLLFPGGVPELGGGKRLREELASSKLNHLRHESLLICKNGAIRNVTWYHSRLHTRLDDDPAVLSVGLDITERLGAESRLAWIADHDTLTGLMNRRRFQEELELALAAAHRHHKTGALLLIDLDHFKYINDTCGHHSGDALLKLVAEALSGETLAADVVARLGGDEFALLLRETDVDDAVEVAKRIQSVLSGVSLAVKGQTLRVTASVGVVLFPVHADNVVDLLAVADLAMYQAKDGGRGYWRMFSANDAAREQIRDRVYWKEKVSRALAEDRFVLYFQPIMEISSGSISHYEVLLRMRDEEGEIIGPSRFIETAERGGMIHAIDRLVVSKAVQLLAELQAGGQQVALSINLSGHAFSDAQLLPHLRHELGRYPVDTSKVIFEITETAAVADFAIANSLMLAIKELGCRFALDDFGIGFSSFYYLKHLPVDYLKIDGSFIRQLADSLDDQIIVRAMSQVAAGFGKKTIAEYVESWITLELLQEYGIDFAQGYLISEPLCAADLFSLKPAEDNLALRMVEK